MTPIISLILPAYNVANYISACLDSCLNQDIPEDDYEIIVVNDGSTDDTFSHLDAYTLKHRNIHVLNQSNQGLSMARNNGVKLARGKYIWFVDSDDVITTHCLGSLVQQMETRNLDLLIAAPSIPYVKDFPESFNPDEDLSPVIGGPEYMLNPQLYGHVIGAWCFVIRSEFWKNNQFEFYRGIAYEDTQLMPWVMSKCQRLAFLNNFSCYSYIQRSGSIMNSAPDKRKLMSHSVIVNTHTEYAKASKDTQLKRIFQNGARNAFIAGLNALAAMKADKSLQHEYMDSIVEKPTYVSAENILKRAFQCAVLTFPLTYVKLKLFLK